MNKFADITINEENISYLEPLLLQIDVGLILVKQE